MLSAFKPGNQWWHDEWIKTMFPRGRLRAQLHWVSWRKVERLFSAKGKHVFWPRITWQVYTGAQEIFLWGIGHQYLERVPGEAAVCSSLIAFQQRTVSQMSATSSCEFVFTGPNSSAFARQCSPWNELQISTFHFYSGVPFKGATNASRDVSCLHLNPLSMPLLPLYSHWASCIGSLMSWETHPDPKPKVFRFPVGKVFWFLAASNKC